MTYPAIIIEKIGEELALVVSCLEEGDLSIVVKHKGKSIKLDKTISTSAINVNKLLKVYPFTLAVSEDAFIKINDIEEYMEVLRWMP
jgi:hypothetical protein